MHGNYVITVHASEAIQGYKNVSFQIVETFWIESQ